MKKEKYMGKFNDKLHNIRDSNRFVYQECIVSASNNVDKALDCVKGYLSGMRNDNDKIVAFGK
jgi:hypothetical protein